MQKRIILLAVPLLVGCVKIPKFDLPPQQPWQVVPLGSNTAILLNDQTGETWINLNADTGWYPMRRVEPSTAPAN
jgi:hypothetical protein